MDNYQTITGIIYVLTNPVMPGIVKIGKTMGHDVKVRMAQLYSTGVPLPFECAYAAKVQKPDEVEKALHRAFGPNRVNPGREFFEIDEIQVISILKLLQIEDVGDEVEKEAETVPQADIVAAKTYNAKKPRFNFLEMGVPIGSVLTAIETGEEAIVQSARSVLFRGQEMSLTSATKLVLENEYNVRPIPHWACGGRTLRDLYDETYIKAIEN